MRHRWASVLGSLCVVGGLYAAACEDPSGTTEFNGDGGVPRSGDGSVGRVPAPPGPPIDFDAATEPPPNTNDGVKCDGVPIGTGALDQEQLAANGAVFLTPTTGKPEQTITTGVGGFLAGIELLVIRESVGTDPTVGSMRVELFDALGNRLGEKLLPLTTFPIVVDDDNVNSRTLSGGPGTGYFPLGALCSKFAAGAVYKIKLSLSDVPDGVCSDVVTDAGTCTVGRIGDRCATHTQCDYRIRVQFGGNSKYDGGTMVGFKSTDLVFRTYVQP